jgi:hypothetical protein
VLVRVPELVLSLPKGGADGWDAIGRALLWKSLSTEYTYADPSRSRCFLDSASDIASAECPFPEHERWDCAVGLLAALPRSFDIAHPVIYRTTLSGSSVAGGERDTFILLFGSHPLPGSHPGKRRCSVGALQHEIYAEED